MPLEGAPLADYCGGPASLCAAVTLNCHQCQSIHKEEAKRRQGKAIKQKPKAK